MGDEGPTSFIPASLRSADPYQFSKHGLEGKVIAAQFALIVILLCVLIYGGTKAVQLGDEVVRSNDGVVEALKGFNVTIYEFKNSIEDARHQHP